ncbi:ATP-binding protein [Streptomyces sp. NPDC051776]|uniref:ATP-binding protein n=1 Tax=Streptomyces sp. NPDC051776 TaxID=3155414 RepID=UPI003417E898
MSRHVVIAVRAEECQVRTVRRFASAHMSRWGLSQQDQDCIVLIIGELAGNAARHGGADMALSLSLNGREICIDVVDTGHADRTPLPRLTDTEDECGRGLGIVDHLASWTDFRAERGGWRSRAGLRVAPPVPATA